MFRKNKSIIISLALFLLVTLCFSIIAHAEVHEEKDVVIQPYDIEAEWLLLVTKDREIQFNVDSNLPVNVYLMTSDEYFDMGWTPYEEEDFVINVLEKRNIAKTSFSWTKPDDQTYYLIIYNPNNVSATVSYSYTETLFEEIKEAFTLFGEICAGTLCFILVVIDLVISLVIAIWIYKDAKERGKNATLWAIFGFVFSIIALIIWLVARPSIDKVPETKTTERVCPNCGRVIPMDARICPYCGRKFEEG